VAAINRESDDWPERENEDEREREGGNNVQYERASPAREGHDQKEILHTIKAEATRENARSIDWKRQRKREKERERERGRESRRLYMLLYLIASMLIKCFALMLFDFLVHSLYDIRGERKRTLSYYCFLLFKQASGLTIDCCVLRASEPPA